MKAKLSLLAILLAFSAQQAKAQDVSIGLPGEFKSPTKPVSPPEAPPAEEEEDEDEFLRKPDVFSISDRNGPNTMSAGVVGETYMGMSMTQIETEEPCRSLVETMKDTLLEPKFTSKSYVYDYTLHCQEIRRHQKVLYVSLIVEPESSYEVASLTAYRERVIGESIHGMKMQFAKLKGFEVEKTFTGVYLPDLRIPVPAHRYSMVSSTVLRFPNFHQFRMHLLKEQAQLHYSADVGELSAYLKKYLHENEMKIFEDQALLKSNVIMVTNSRRNVFMSNQKADAPKRDSHMTACEKFGTKFCKVN